MITVSTIAETHEFAKKLALELDAGTLLGLSGPLGAGKTEFVRGFAAALGVPEDEVSSPTFVLESVYSLPKTSRGIEELHHWDLYRLDEEEIDILESHGNAKAITLVEWPERVSSVLGALDLRVFIEVDSDQRQIKVISN